MSLSLARENMTLVRFRSRMKSALPVMAPASLWVPDTIMVSHSPPWSLSTVSISLRWYLKSLSSTVRRSPRWARWGVMTDTVAGGTSCSSTPRAAMMSYTSRASNRLLFREQDSSCTTRYTPFSSHMSANEDMPLLLLS